MVALTNELTLPLNTYNETLLFSLCFLIKRCGFLLTGVCFLPFVESSNNNMMLRFLVSLLVLASCKDSYKMAKAQYTLDSLRASLVREEDTIIFALIERARFPLNSPTYNQSYTSQLQGSLLQFIIRNTEAIQSKVPLLRLSLLIYSLLVLILRLAILFLF